MIFTKSDKPRTALSSLTSDFVRYRGKVRKIGNVIRGVRTVLLINVYRCDNDCLVSKHLWIRDKKLSEMSGELSPEDWIEFDAIAFSYDRKTNNTVDFSLKSLKEITRTGSLL